MAQIMIVEDNQGTNKAICEYLKTAGHTLFPALDGEEALNIFRDNSIDLAVLDIMLTCSAIIIADTPENSNQLLQITLIHTRSPAPPASVSSRVLPAVS